MIYNVNIFLMQTVLKSWEGKLAQGLASTGQQPTQNLGEQWGMEAEPGRNDCLKMQPSQRIKRMEWGHEREREGWTWIFSWERYVLMEMETQSRGSSKKKAFGTNENRPLSGYLCVGGRGRGGDDKNNPTALEEARLCQPAAAGAEGLLPTFQWGEI